MFLGRPSFHWYQSCEFCLSTRQVTLVSSWLHGHVGAQDESCNQPSFAYFCSKWPSILHHYHTDHPFSFLKWPKQEFLMHAFVPVHLAKKGKWSSVHIPTLLFLTCQPTHTLFTSFLWSQNTQNNP